jgi:excisionase family DNA binding protein
MADSTKPRRRVNRAAPTTDTRVWVDRIDASVYLGVAPITIDRMVDDGRLPGYRLAPRGVRFRLADLDAFLEPIPARTSQGR